MKYLRAFPDLWWLPTKKQNKFGDSTYHLLHFDISTLNISSVVTMSSLSLSVITRRRSYISHLRVSWTRNGFPRTICNYETGNSSPNRLPLPLPHLQTARFSRHSLLLLNRLPSPGEHNNYILSGSWFRGTSAVAVAAANWQNRLRFRHNGNQQQSFMFV